eukprot:jgi/Mesen1/9822/ME000007S09891
MPVCLLPSSRPWSWGGELAGRGRGCGEAEGESWQGDAWGTGGGLGHRGRPGARGRWTCPWSTVGRE